VVEDMNKVLKKVFLPLVRNQEDWQVRLELPEEKFLDIEPKPKAFEKAALDKRTVEIMVNVLRKWCTQLEALLEVNVRLKEQIEQSADLLLASLSSHRTTLSHTSTTPPS